MRNIDPVSPFGDGSTVAVSLSDFRTPVKAREGQLTALRVILRTVSVAVYGMLGQP